MSLYASDNMASWKDVKQRGMEILPLFCIGETMAREFAKAFYQSDDWKRTREYYIASVDGLCENCLAKGIYTPGEIVHHKIHLNPVNISDPKVTLNMQNLRLLCRNCHAEEHAKDKGMRYQFSATGEIIFQN